MLLAVDVGNTQTVFGLYADGELGETRRAATEADRTGDELGVLLSQVTTRVLVWWIDTGRDFRRGDRLEIVYEQRVPEEPIVHAVWFQSGKAGRNF